MAENNDFTVGSVAHNIMKLAIPMTLAQLINVLYNVVDRMYIGRIPDASTLALTGLGLTFPIITIIIAFSNLFGMGGAPLFSIARGSKEEKKAQQIMGNSFFLLVLFGFILTILGLLFKKPILYLFGASDATFPYANDYITIYLIGSIFVMIGLGMNHFINAQGFGKIGMMTVLLGAFLNILLDPLFIFVFHLGVRGAAFATILSQFASAFWVLHFLTNNKAAIKLNFPSLKLQASLVKNIVLLGLSSFVMSITNSAVQIICNVSLQFYGGDIYVGVMTVLNSIREILSMPVNGLTNASQPFLGYNYGAKQYKRVFKGIQFMSVSCISFTTISWIILMIFPAFFIRIFNDNPILIQYGIPAMHLYFFGFFMMSFQFSGQSTFVALEKSKHAIFFSLLRKVVIVIPLTLFLPKAANLGVTGVFLAEPISNFIGGTACFSTMLLTVGRELKRKEKANHPLS